MRRVREKKRWRKEKNEERGGRRRDQHMPSLSYLLDSL